MSFKAIREKKIALKISEFTEFEIGPNKRIPVFRVTQPYLNSLMKPRIFFRFSGKKYNFMHLKGEIKLYCFPEKK